MAISQNFLTGRMKKSAGGTRFSTWRGLNVVASKPIEVRQNVTKAVQVNRDKMSVIGKMVSKLNPIVNSVYSLGIAKTTPFADTVKFFRSRIKDDLTLDASLLAGASFGTGNVPSCDYMLSSDSFDAFVIAVQNYPSIWGNDGVDNTVIMFNDTCTKVGVWSISGIISDFINIDPSEQGFVAGDKIAFAVKPVRFRPGADLSGKMKLMSEASFITLT